MEEWAVENEKRTGLNKFRWWDREYIKFCYTPLAAGPKFLLFLILALTSLVTRPPHIPKRVWYFLAFLWIVPIILFYTNASTDFARRGPWLTGGFRFIFPFLALLTIQGLVVIQKIKTYFKEIDFFLVALIAWDLFYININHRWEIAVLYPLLITALLITIISLKLSHKIMKSWMVYPAAFIVFFMGIHLLQTYRDSTRYNYYHEYTDYVDIPRDFVNAWEFLDQPDGKKTIAMTMGWKPPGGNWFFYPLMGRWLQNDIVYISAKYKWEVPTWLHRGLLRGNDSSIWLYNLKRKKVGYILVQTPWPVELTWMQNHPEEFQLVFSDKECKIFKYNGKTV